jgi:ubiquitin-protein ligase
MSFAMDPRLRRLQADYQGVRDLFSGHPHVSIEPAEERRPPERYRVTYRLQGLTLESEQPVLREVHNVVITLPRDYPRGKPYCVPLDPIFHPNIRDYFCIADHWAASMSLADVIVTLGDMIQWKSYNPRSPLDAIAAKWAVEQERTQSNLFPIGNVNLGVGEFEIALKNKRSEPVVEGAPRDLPLAPLTSDDADELVPDGDLDFEISILSR